MKRLGICTATRWEFNAVRRSVADASGRRGFFMGRQGPCEVVGIRTGVGMTKAREACGAMLDDHPVDLVISSGFACALGVSGVGELLVGTTVIGEPSDSDFGSDHEWSCAAEVIEGAVCAARIEGMPARTGRFVTVPRVLWRADEKRRIAARTGAVGLDMESAAVGSAAAERGVPFAVLRTVSDLLDEDLPLDFNLFLNPIDWPKGTLACLARPSALLELNRLRAQAAIAAERLTVFFRRFFDDLHG
ncbi:MAG: hypothetical protein ACREJU_06415 [Nitrospiraceae bacterium]